MKVRAGDNNYRAIREKMAWEAFGSNSEEYVDKKEAKDKGQRHSWIRSLLEENENKKWSYEENRWFCGYSNLEKTLYQEGRSSYFNKAVKMKA